MSKFTKSLFTKSFKYGSRTSLAVVLVIAALAAVNLGFEKINLRYDLTIDKLFTISDETKEIINGLAEDVTIYPVFAANAQDNLTNIITELIDAYSAESRHIKVVYKDPMKDPQFTMQYSENGESLPGGTIIVTCGEKFKVISPDNLLTSEFNYETFQNELQSVDVEPQLSNAILYVTAEETPIVYVTRGHEESGLPEALASELSLANYELASIDLITSPDIPQNCGLLMIMSPLIDFTEDETNKVLSYLQNGGKAMLFLDAKEEPFENLTKILGAYNVSESGAFVAEGNPNYYVQDYPLNLVLAQPQTEAAYAVWQKVRALLAPNAQAIFINDGTNEDILIEPFAVTSDNSYAKTAPEITRIDKEEGDTDGPFNICVGAENEKDGSRIVVFGNSYVLDESVNNFVGGGNYKFVTNAVNWTQNKASSVYIAPKTMRSEYLQLTQSSFLVLAFISVILIPVTIIVIGLFIWFKRKRI